MKAVIPSGNHSELDSLRSEKSIDKLVNSVGVMDKSRRKSKQVKVPREAQIAPT